MRYLPLTPEERNEILKLANVSSFEELTSSIPENLRLKGLLDLEAALTEEALVKKIRALAKKNRAAEMTSFMGQGAYDHGWPRVIDQISNRGEFLTAYTPYQPEISQGTLTSIFEFQSMITELFGMEVSNASLYDGSTSLLEAVLMATRLQGQDNGIVLVSEGLFEETRRVLEGYLLPLGFELQTWWADSKSFVSTEATLPEADAFNGKKVVATVLQSPNKWGLVEDWSLLNQAKAKLNSKTIAHVPHALSLAYFSPPGEHDIDIATGEGQALGIPVGFGGPYLGLFCCKKQDIRQMPGRLVGETVDSKGQRAFCVTLATREQHIRREKATSNICSNQNLMALRASMYLSLMGPHGLEELAHLCRNKAHHARKLISESLSTNFPNLKVLEGECFNEISILVPQKNALWLDQTLSLCEENGVMAGLRNSVPASSGFVSALTVAFTEKHSFEDIDHLVQLLLHKSPIKHLGKNTEESSQ